MSTLMQDTTDTEHIHYGTTLIHLTRRSDGTWEATQQGFDHVGTGESAARATDDLAGQIAAQLETTTSEQTN